MILRRPLPSDWRPVGEAGDLTQCAMRNYQPKQYDGDVVLLRGDWRRSRDEGWTQVVTGRLDIRGVAGDHRSLLEPPDVDHLAAGLERALLGAAPDTPVGASEHRNA